MSCIPFPVMREKGHYSMNKVKKVFVFAKSSTLCVYSSICSDSHFVLGIPIANGVLLSFQDVLKDKWVGMNNYKRLLLIHISEKQSGTVLNTWWEHWILIPFPMLFASMLNSKLMKAKGFFQVCLFYPGTDICCRCRYNLPSDVW